MKKIYYAISILIVAILIVLFLPFNNKIPTSYSNSETEVSILPDYKEVTFPINIAPANFRINEKATRYLVRFSSSDYQFVVQSKKSLVDIPRRKWKKLLAKAGNNNFTVEIFGKQENKKWVKFTEFRNNVTTDSIDNYIAFRHINAGYILWENMGIYQRNLESYKKTPILLNSETNNNCMHCHTFHRNDPNKMLIHLRANPSGTLLYNNGEVKFINTKTDSTLSAGVYPSWHPNGNLIAFSVNNIRQKFHSHEAEQISVFDLESDIIIYNIEKNSVQKPEKLSTAKLENLPVWSHDGKYLYFISTDSFNESPDSIKYDLFRIAYNEKENQWGKIDTLLTTKETNLSITFPELSPDGKYLLFTMTDYGYFSVHRHNSDLYLMDLETFNYEKLHTNSNQTESFHSWSSSGKWFLFISKRLDGLYSRVYFSHINNQGEVSKPFILPQKDPNYYDYMTVNYNRPVFIKDKVKANSHALSEKAFTKAINSEYKTD